MNILSVSVSKRVFELLSLNSLAVVLEFDNEGLDVLSLSLPIANAPLSIRIEVLFLLVEESLSLNCVPVLITECVLGGSFLSVSLLLQELNELQMALTLFFALLLLSKLELLVAHLPEFGEVLFFLEFVFLLFLSSFDLKRAGAFNGLLHFEFTALLLLVKTVSLIFSFGHLFVKDLFLVVTESAELFNLLINKLLTHFQLVFLS